MDANDDDIFIVDTTAAIMTLSPDPSAYMKLLVTSRIVSDETARVIVLRYLVNYYNMRKFVDDTPFSLEDFRLMTLKDLLAFLTFLNENNFTLRNLYAECASHPVFKRSDDPLPPHRICD